MLLQMYGVILSNISCYIALDNQRKALYSIINEKTCLEGLFYGSFGQKIPCVKFSPELNFKFIHLAFIAETGRADRREY